MLWATDYTKLSSFRVQQNDGNEPEVTGVACRGNDGCA